MDIVQVQQEPHPVYEVKDFKAPDLWPLTDWLYEENLPEDMSLAFRAGMYHFRTRSERYMFASGMRAMFG